jgi:endonuclease-3
MTRTKTGVGRARAARSTSVTATRQRVARAMHRLGLAMRAMAEPAVEKIAEEEHSDPFKVLVATMLSAQTRDPVTFEASNRLFARAATPREMVKLRVSTIEKLIYPVSFYRHKAEHLRETCRLLLDRYGGLVPSTMPELLTLPGVGRKTANLVLIVALKGEDNICVDTHVHRISNRLGWVETRTPEETERALYQVAARRWWPQINLYLVTWGQNVCKPVYPTCGRCAIATLCQRIGVAKVGK